MCCRLQMDLREIRKKTGGLFGAQEMMLDERCANLGGATADCQVRPVVDNYVQAFTKAPLLGYLLNVCVDLFG